MPVYVHRLPHTASRGDFGHGPRNEGGKGLCGDLEAFGFFVLMYKIIRMLDVEFIHSATG